MQRLANQIAAFRRDVVIVFAEDLAQSVPILKPEHSSQRSEIKDGKREQNKT